MNDIEQSLRVNNAIYKIANSNFLQKNVRRQENNL
jgi:hypothetical protein